MGSLHRRDYERMLDLMAAVTGSMLREDPWFLITQELNDCLRGNATIFETQLRPVARTSNVVAWAPGPAGRSAFEPRIRARGGEHPFTAIFAAGGDHAPLTVNDVLDDRQWRRNSWYEATHRRFDGAIRHLGLPLRSPPGTVRAFVACRSGRDFGARERELARRLQPLLVSVDRHQTELKRIRDQVPPAQAITGEQAAALGITPRETTVLGLLAQGLTAAAIARRLAISLHTVSKHQENAYRKLGTTDRLTTVLRAQDLGIIGRSGPVDAKLNPYRSQRARRARSTGDDAQQPS